MQTQTKNTKNLDSIVQHLKKSDAITKLLKQHKIFSITILKEILNHELDNYSF